MENNVNDGGITQFHCIKKNYKWEIKDLIIYEGGSLSSPTFSTKFLNWKIMITWYNDSVTPFYVRLIPERKGTSRQIFTSQMRVKVRLSFIINREEHILQEGRIYPLNLDCTLYGNTKIYDKIKDITVSDKNILTVICRLKEYNGHTSNINELENTIFEQNNNDLSKDLSKLLEDKTYCDVTLVTEEKEFTAHKAVLVARSPVFYAMFKTNMVEKKENKVDIKNVKPNVLSAMLNYIYSQKVENIDEIDVELLEVAERFGIEGLKILCSGALLKKMSVQNVAETLIWADLHNAAYVKTQALNFIALNKNDVLNTEGFKMLMKSHPNLGIELFGKI